MSDLLLELQETRKNLNKALSVSVERGKALATAEADYKEANAKYILAARANSVPATLIKELAQGDAVVGKLRLQRDIARTLYDSAREAINVYKLDARLIEAQIQREWGAAGEQT